MMIKISKKTAFFLTLISCTLAAISLYRIDWDILKKGNGLFEELGIFIVFLIFTFYFTM